jgi:hypothetical protein
MGMANLQAGPTVGDDMATGVSGLSRTRYPEMVRLADLLGADDPQDNAQEAFARLLRKSSSSAIASRPASGSPVVVNMGGGIVNHAKLSEYYGVRPSPAAGRGGPGRRRQPR